MLVQQPDGSWAVVDQNSTNGTTVNGGEEPIQPFVPVPLQDGDRVHVGAWTTITVRRGSAGGGLRQANGQAYGPSGSSSHAQARSPLTVMP